MATMKEQAAKAMRQGAFGLSTGLEYAPDRFSTTEELIEICRVVSSLQGFYATHIRSEDNELMEATAEAIHIAEKTDIPLQISHLKASGRPNYHKARLVLDLMEKAGQRGVKISADRYPYTAFNTTLSIMFPAWALEGGGWNFCARLKEKSLREKMKPATLKKVEGNNSWKSMVIQAAANSKNKKFLGMDIRTAAEQEDMDPYELACDLLISEGGELRIIGFGMSEVNTEMILSHPLVMVASDGSSLAQANPSGRGFSHPRNFGTFPRFLRLYSLEKELLSLPEAIMKMTSFPARKMGLKKRGVLAKGYFADIVVFDPKKLKDNATYLYPQLYPDGIDHVIVNGRSVVFQGAHTGSLPGHILYGPAY
jgi:N-acyl-D-amino-acid deacylase